ncbi:MAG: MYXO-CTERM sorting domain-containing protein [Sandaracinaceae bacterium]|nr:MYXO-CTERM sorting domain-containing protein [Sandaracinaceae bacterium]
MGRLARRGRRGRPGLLRRARALRGRGRPRVDGGGVVHGRSSAAPLDAGMRPDAGPGVTPVSPGCGCAVPRPGAPHAHLALLALALLAVRRRRP